MWIAKTELEKQDQIEKLRLVSHRRNQAWIYLGGVIGIFFALLIATMPYLPSFFGGPSNVIVVEPKRTFSGLYEFLSLVGISIVICFPLGVGAGIGIYMWNRSKSRIDEDLKIHLDLRRNSSSVCLKCGKVFPRDILVCPNCGESLVSSLDFRWDDAGK